MDKSFKILDNNEDEFISFWAERMEFRENMILHNVCFSEDPWYNHCTVIPANTINLRETVKKIIQLFESKKIHPCIYVPDLDEYGGFRNMLVEMGFQIYDKMIIMSNRGKIQTFETEKKFEMKIINENEVESWCSVFMNSFGISPLWKDELLKRCYSAQLDSRISLYLATYLEKAVGTTILFSDKNIGGIYCVGTISPHRDLGIATGLLHKAIRDSRRKGDRIITLQTLYRDGLTNFYSRRGFDQIYVKEIYVKL